MARTKIVISILLSCTLLVAACGGNDQPDNGGLLQPQENILPGTEEEHKLCLDMFASIPGNIAKVRFDFDAAVYHLDGKQYTEQELQNVNYFTLEWTECEDVGIEVDKTNKTLRYSGNSDGTLVDVTFDFHGYQDNLCILFADSADQKRAHLTGAMTIGFEIPNDLTNLTKLFGVMVLKEVPMDAYRFAAVTFTY